MSIKFVREVSKTCSGASRKFVREDFSKNVLTKLKQYDTMVVIT